MSLALPLGRCERVSALVTHYPGIRVAGVEAHRRQVGVGTRTATARRRRRGGRNRHPGRGRDETRSGLCHAAPPIAELLRSGDLPSFRRSGDLMIWFSRGRSEAIRMPRSSVGDPSQAACGASRSETKPVRARKSATVLPNRPFPVVRDLAPLPVVHGLVHRRPAPRLRERSTKRRALTRPQ